MINLSKAPGQNISSQPPNSTSEPTKSDQFRALLKKVGSGTHTSKSLTRAEAAIATELMLSEAATPAQIGAFMIAHRIKRPTPTELAGMLDTYDALGPQLEEVNAEYPVTVFCSPYDGRSRTAPITPLTALVMATANAPALLHGSGRLPTKHGLPLIEIFQGLGLNWPNLSLDQVQTVLGETHLGFVHQPVHFPQAEAMVPYREQIGKRPTFATIEIMWSPYAGRSNLVSGYVHPPTEGRTQAAFTQRGTPFFTTVKGLEGSSDMARARTAIIGLSQLKGQTLETERLLLHPRDYGFDSPDPEILPLEELLKDYRAVLAGQTTEIGRSAVWNSGFYLWRVGRVKNLAAGFELARSLLAHGAVASKLEAIKTAIDACAN
ncbi:MAG: anthranilate phosphoribosyltransferase family protein [Phormidesmis sp.]